MYYHKSKDIVYAITESDIQSEAEYGLGRQLTDEELHIAVKGLEWGIGESLRIVYRTIFTEMIPAHAEKSK
ncbi:MAG: hypothetical protein LBT46_11150 [Planctomycetaceae bacterium]|jgi:hypothetical protein|nr:hypothetical protein [Planctomycetaceae bacterium]